MSKMVFHLIIVSFILILFSCEDTTSFSQQTNHDPVEGTIDSTWAHRIADSSVAQFISGNHKINRGEYPISVNNEGKLVTSSVHDWTAGFYPGTAWHLYSITKNEQVLEIARNWTANLEVHQHTKGTHDIGFIIMNSFGQGHKITGDVRYKDIIIQAARTLSERFNPTLGMIKSWDVDYHDFPVIIDNMMNLELLFYATKISGDSSYYSIAVSHAEKTMNYHIREDNSVYQFVDFNAANGNVKSRGNHQGETHTSTWSRGLAWGIYGFTMCFRETGNLAFLQTAENLAEFYLEHPNLTNDLVPFWDLNASGIPNTPRDASAGAIIASALFELSGYMPANPTIRRTAEQMLFQLGHEPYFSKYNTNHNFFLKQGTGHYPAGQYVNAPLNYADYYFAESLKRYLNHF